MVKEMLQAIEIETPAFDEEVDLSKTWKRQSDLLRPLIPLTKDTQSIILEYLQPIVDYKKISSFVSNIEITFCNDAYIVFKIYANDMADVSGIGWSFGPSTAGGSLAIRENGRAIRRLFRPTTKKYEVSFPDQNPLFENQDFKLCIRDGKAYKWKDNDWQAF